MRLDELLRCQAENNAVAIKHGDRTLSYSDWNKQSLKMAKNLESVLTRASMNIALFLPNSIDYAIAYFSILFSDKIIVPIGIQSKGLEIMSTLEYCEIDMIITNYQYHNFLKECLSAYKHRVLLFYVEDQNFEILNGNKPFVVKSDIIKNVGIEDDVAIMLHTSGTISNPKRVMLTHINLISNVESNIKSLKLSNKDKVLISMPMYFGYCNTAQFLTHLYLGASMVILDGMFLPKPFFQTVQNEKITNFTGVPSMLLMLLEYHYIDKYDISSLRYICFGGGKMPVEKLQKLIHVFKSVGFVQTYGQTEASPRTTALLPENALKKIGSIGLPIPNVKVEIINEVGCSLSANQIGEIVIHGKNVMKGYYKQEKITADVLSNGWLHTGDLGYKDEEGYIYLTGRKKNIIISGGINIYPEEIEEVLMSHPNVNEVYVVGEKHALLGEVPVAKIVTQNDLDSNDYRAFCVGKLADYKIPIRYDIVTQLDKTYNGKIKRYRKED